MALNKILSGWALIVLCFFSLLSIASEQERIDSLRNIIPKLDGCEKQVAIGKLAFEFNGSQSFEQWTEEIAPLRGQKLCLEAEAFFVAYRADSFFIRLELDSAITWHKRLMVMADSCKNKRLYIKSLVQYGYANSLAGSFNETVEYYPTVLDYYQKLNNYEVYEFAAKSFLNALLSLGLYTQLEQEAQAMIESATARNSKSFLAVCNYFLASSSFEANLKERAQTFNRKALNWIDTIRSINDVYTLLGVHALNQKLYQSEGMVDSLKYTLKQLDSLVIYLDYRQKAWHLTNWAEFYIDQQEYENALVICDSLLRDERMKTDGVISYIFMIRSKASALFELGRFEDAIKTLRPAIAFYKERENYDELRHCYALMAKANYHNLNPDSGDFFQEQFRTIQDSVYSSDMRAQLAEQEIRFETQQKEAKLAAQDQLLLEQAETAEQQKLTITIIVITLALLMGLVFGVYRSRQKLATSNRIVEKRSAQLADKNEENELLLKEIHHRVKNNLQVIMSLLDLQAMRLDESASKEALLSSQTRIKSMALIHEELYQQARFSVIKFDEYLEILVSNISDVFAAGEEAEISKDIVKTEIDLDTAIPLALIVNEVLTNAFKYGKNTLGKLNVSMKATLINGVLDLEIRDDGKGIPESVLGGKPTSLGLRIVKRLAKQIASTYTLEGSETGTVFRISTPLNNHSLA